jgi:hypothetical protein
VETGALVGEPHTYRLRTRLDSLRVPATVQAVLVARIDRLPPEEKHLLQTAAVIGTEVLFPLPQTIVEIPQERLYRGLAHLQADPDRALAAGQRVLVLATTLGGDRSLGGDAALPRRHLPQPGGLSAGGGVLPNERDMSPQRAEPGVPQSPRAGRGVRPQSSRRRAGGVRGLR